MILRYNKFLKEKLEVSQNDSTGIVAKKNYINDLEKHIKEFSSKKTQLERIYTNYTDDKNLLQLLKNSGFIDKTIDNTRKVEFLNPLFSIYFRACEKMRQLNNLSKSIDELKTSITEKEKTLQSDSSQASLRGEIEQMKNQLKEKTRQLDTYNSNINDIKTQTQNKIRDMEVEFQQAIKDTRKAIQEN